MHPLTRPVERALTASRAAEQRQALAARQPRSQAEQVGLSRIRAGVRDQPGRIHNGAGQRDPIRPSGASVVIRLRAVGVTDVDRRY
jgi:hypothetical protein